MTTINKCREIIREENGIMLGNRRDWYEELIKNVGSLKNDLQTYNTEESINETIKKLSEMIDNMHEEKINGIVADITGVIQGVKMHDITRTALVDMLQKLVEKLEKIVEEEKEKEKADNLRKLFLKLAEHSEEISQWFLEEEFNFDHVCDFEK